MPLQLWQAENQGYRIRNTPQYLEAREYLKEKTFVLIQNLITSLIVVILKTIVTLRNEVVTDFFDQVIVLNLSFDVQKLFLMI
jgi:hypothetical protein